jgi:hypothetical protein
VKNFIANLFKGPNGCWDLGRLIGAKAASAYTFAFLYALIVKSAVPDWSALGMGYTGVLGGVGLLIGIKDIAVAKANATPSAPPTMPPAMPGSPVP